VAFNFCSVLLLLAQGALKVLPTSLVAERAVLQGLACSGSNAYLTALQVGRIYWMAATCTAAAL
jgi:hypothetical protein